MIIDKILDFLLIRVLLKFKKKVVIDVFNKQDVLYKRALLYYKTDCLFSKRLLENSPHTNDFEIIQIINTLDKLDFIVDFIDRSAVLSQIEFLRGFQYKLIISNCGGNSSPLHSEISNSFQYEHLLAYAMGPEPILSIQLVKQRHLEFEQRTGVIPVVRRLVNGSASELESRFEKSSAIIVNSRTFSFESYKKYNKPIYYVPSIVNEDIVFNQKSINSKSFLYFGGNGLICKGLDIVLEAFDGMSDLELHVCGPDTEEDFWGYYQPLLNRNPQIKYHGFVKVGSDKFYNIMNKVTFNVFTSAAEGLATSVLTTMRMGVIPVINYESGVPIDGFGYSISEEQSKPKELRKLLVDLSQVNNNKLERKSILTHKASMEFCQDNFKNRLIDAIQQLTNKG